MAETPTAAFVLSLLGGIFIVFGGLALVAIAALVGALGSLGGLSSLTGGLGNLSSIPSLTGELGNATSTLGSSGVGGGSIAVVGEFGVLLGIATIALAVLIYKVPARHQLWGALVLTFSVLSWIGALGGLLLGFIMGLIGGVLAITWKPSTALPASPPAQITRICPNCGTVVQKDAKFCSYCGKSLP